MAKKPRLSRVNAAFLLKGQAGSAVPGDTLVAAAHSAKLQPYDQALRRFKCVLSLCTGGLLRELAPCIL